MGEASEKLLCIGWDDMNFRRPANITSSLKNNVHLIIDNVQFYC